MVILFKAVILINIAEVGSTSRFINMCGMKIYREELHKIDMHTVLQKGSSLLLQLYYENETFMCIYMCAYNIY